MAYEPKYRSDVVKTDYVGIPVGNKIVQGYQTTFKDGTSKFITLGDANLSSNFDYSTFTSKKDANGKWVWSPTTDKSIANLATQQGLTETDIKKSLYQTPQITTVLNGNRVNQLGGISKAQKLDPELPGTTGTSTANPYQPDNSAALKSDLQKELSEEYNTKTRNEYENLKYPLNLKSENQDCIKFSIIKYIPVGINQQAPGNRNISLVNGVPQKSGSPLGTITLPIPGGIRDRNSVSWQEDRIDEITKSFADVALRGITEGSEGASEAASEKAKNISPTSLKQFVASKFTELATGSANIMSRQYGAIINPNLELLFTGPSLRSFSFNFKMSPRSSTEAKEVQKIIRTFKQAMSTKRSDSTLLLKAPHTFAISYISSNKQHPYLNKFKECALIDFSVDYAPDGTYMTYTGTDPNDINSRSMTAYELTLTFQELEPIFDDDYGKDYNNVGY